MHPRDHKQSQRECAQVGGGCRSVSDGSSDKKAPATVSLSLAMLRISVRPLQTIPSISSARPSMANPPFCLARFRPLARTHTLVRPCTHNAHAHAHAYAHPTAAGFPVSSSLSSWPTLPLLSPPRDSAPPCPMTESALHFPSPQPDRKTTHAFAWPSPALNKYILARQPVLLAKYLPCPLFVPSSLASRRIGAPSGPAHFPTPAAAAPTLFKVVLLAILPVCPSTFDIGPRQHTGKLDR